MYVKEDYISYINQMKEIELRMRDNMKELSTMVKNERALQIINNIYDDEKNHAKSLEIIIEILNKL